MVVVVLMIQGRNVVYGVGNTWRLICMDERDGTVMIGVVVGYKVDGLGWLKSRNVKRARVLRRG